MNYTHSSNYCPICGNTSLRVSYSIVRDIRHDAFANMEKLGMSYFDKTCRLYCLSFDQWHRDYQWYVFKGSWLSFISAVFIFGNPLYLLVLDYRPDSFGFTLFTFDFLLVNLYRKKSVKVIEKTRSQSNTNSKLVENIERIRIIQISLIKKSACKKSLMR